jgi:MYXO-CTERM domain-containing protein
MKTLKTWLAAAAMVALTGAAQAALISLGNGTVKDDNTNLIWLQDWNVNGVKSLAAQTNWAETTLDGFAGSSDWRLPSLDEYIALFSAYGDLAQLTAFTNVANRSFYWSSTEDPQDQTSGGIFETRGITGWTPKSERMFAVAVRPGDVAAPVPEPQTLALALLALGATVVTRRRRPA